MNIYTLTLSHLDWPIFYFTLSNSRRFYSSRESSPSFVNDIPCKHQSFLSLLYSELKLFLNNLWCKVVDSALRQCTLRQKQLTSDLSQCNIQPNLSLKTLTAQAISIWLFELTVNLSVYLLLNTSFYLSLAVSHGNDLF